MKKISLALPFLLAVVPAAAQNQIRPRIASAIPRAEENQSTASRGRTVTTTTAVPTDSPPPEAKPVWGDSAIAPKVTTPVVNPTPAPIAANVQNNTSMPPRLVKPT